MHEPGCSTVITATTAIFLISGIRLHNLCKLEFFHVFRDISQTEKTDQLYVNFGEKKDRFCLDDPIIFVESGNPGRHWSVSCI